MEFSRQPAAPRSRFCAAPWLESVLYNDGSYRICCRNSRVFGNWKEMPLAETWKGPELRAFREQVARGEYPDSDCAACHRAGTAQSLARILGTPLINAVDHLFRQGWVNEGEKASLKGIAELFDDDRDEVGERITLWEDALADLRARRPVTEAAAAEFNKVANILAITRAYHAGDPAPPVVGPFRQVQLIAKCNARCVMCPGKFTGEIVNGGAIEEAEITRAMDAPADIVDFFCNGSEFLLFKGWKQVAHALKAGGTANLRISTNGMLLTRDTVDYLLEHELIGHLNVSFNAGTKETLERVQAQVKWDRLLMNVNYLIESAEAKGAYFPLSFSFIVMRSNLADLKEFLAQVGAFKRRCRLLDPNVMLMGLENAGAKDYRSFLYDEHLGFVSHGEVERAFREANVTAEAEGISVQLYNFASCRTLREYVAAGFPVQGFVEQPAADREQIEIQVRAGLDGGFQAELARAREAMAADFAAAFAREAVFPVGDAVSAALGRIAEARHAFDRLPPLEPSAGLRNLFGAAPACREFFLRYRDERRNQLADRLRRDLEVSYWKLFEERLGRGRDALADHRGEKYLAFPGAFPLRSLAIGSRLLGRDMRYWTLVYLSERSVYLKAFATNEVRLVSHDFVVGAFVLDEPLAVIPLKIQKLRARAFFQTEYHEKLNTRYEQLLEEGKEKVHALLLAQAGAPQGGLLPGDMALAFERVRRDQRGAFLKFWQRLLAEGRARAAESRLRLDERTIRLYENWAERKFMARLDKQLERFRTRRVLALLGLPRTALRDHFGMQHAQIPPERLQPGALVLGADHAVWIFLRRRGPILYLASEGQMRVQILPVDFLLGAFPFEPAWAGPELVRACSRADFHSRVNRLKQKLVGGRKSKLLWRMSQAYRAGLKRFGVETTEHLVIR